MGQSVPWGGTNCPRGWDKNCLTCWFSIRISSSNILHRYENLQGITYNLTILSSFICLHTLKIWLHTLNYLLKINKLSFSVCSVCKKLKIKIVKGEHFLCPPFGYQMMRKLFFLIGWCGIRHQTQQQFEYMLIALGIDTTEMLNCPIPKRWPLVIDKDTRIHFLSSIAKL